VTVIVAVFVVVPVKVAVMVMVQGPPGEALAERLQVLAEALVVSGPNEKKLGAPVTV